jgi:hypothetical protein
MIPFRQVRKPESGQASAEFILTIGFLMLFVLAFLELIAMVYTYNVLADSAKEGVRFAIVHGTLSSNCNGPGITGVTCDTTAAGVVSAVTTYAQYSLHDTSAMTVSVDYNPTGQTGGAACNKPGCMVRVTVNYPYQPFFGMGWPTVTVNAAAEGRITF